MKQFELNERRNRESTKRFSAEHIIQSHSPEKINDGANTLIARNAIQII